MTTKIPKHFKLFMFGSLFFLLIFLNLVVAEKFSSGSANTEFLTNYGERLLACSPPQADGDLYWINSTSTIPALNDCYKETVASGSSHTCCKQGFTCITGKCVFSEVYDCSDYKTQEECDNYARAIAEADISEKGATCGDYAYIGEENGAPCYNSTSNCMCKWDPFSRNCTSSFNLTKICDTAENLGKCTFSNVIKTNCTLGFRTMNWSASWTGPENKPAVCANGERQAPCLYAELKFSSLSGIIIVIILIIIFYLLTNKKKKKK